MGRGIVHRFHGISWCPRPLGLLRGLGGAGGRRNYLDSDDLLLFARGVGHTLSMLLNSAFALPAFKKAATPATFPSLACRIQVPAIFLHMAMSRSESKRQRSPLGVAGVPSDQWPTGIMNSVIGSGAP